MAPEQRTTHVDTQAELRRVDSETDMSVMSEGDFDPNTYKVRRSRLIGMVNWTHVVVTHAPQILAFGIVVLIAQLINQVVMDLSSKVEHQASPGDLEFSLETIVAVLEETKNLLINIYKSIAESHGLVLLSPEVKTTAIVLIIGGWLMRMDNPCYLLAFANFHAPDDWRVSHDQIIQMMKNQECFTDKSIDFMTKILANSATGQATAWPPGMTQSLKGKKADRSIEASRKEAEAVIFTIVEDALKKAKVTAKEIDVLVINCSLFSPTPSLCAMVISKFGMRSDIASYNLSGMGCGASLISVGLAKDLLQRRNFGGKALVVSTEIITPNLYHGNDRGFLIQNTLFRCGGAAMVLSNKWTDGRKAWYKLLNTVRVQGNDLVSYNAVYETQCDDGERGVRLSKDIVKVAGKCMEKNMTMLGPYVLPLTEQIRVVLSLMKKHGFKALKKSGIAKNLPPVKVYVPDFKRGIDHFCIHAGGRAVIDGIEKNMKLEVYHTEPSRMALMNYGNTSSSSIWYELEYIQEHQRSNPLKKGDRIMQVAFGSGFKCTSGVWLKL